MPGGSWGEILSYLDSPSPNVALRDVRFTFFGFFMFSSTPPSLNVALQELGFTFLVFLFVSPSLNVALLEVGFTFLGISWLSPFKAVEVETKLINL